MINQPISDERLIALWLMRGGEINNVSVNDTPSWSVNWSEWGVNNDHRCADDGGGLPILNGHVRKSMAETLGLRFVFGEHDVYVYQETK